jgi:hypothetical protein
MDLRIRSTPILAGLAALAALTLVKPALAGDPTTLDCLTASEKSLTLKNDHKLRAARAQLLVCAQTQCPADIRKECSRRVDEINAAIPTIVFGAKDPQGNDLTSVKVTMDGEVITERLEGTAISLDPGAHTFTFQAPGQPLLTKQIVVREGEKERREILQIGNRAEAPKPPPPPVQAPLQPALPPAPPPEASKPLGGQRIAALVVGGVGIVGLGLGAAFGGLAMSKHNEAKKECPDAGCLTQKGVDLWDAARLNGNISTVGLVVGGVALAGGVVLWVTGNPQKRKTTALGFGPGSITFQEVW